ncbi:MAG: ketol-acid reductoisomerase, partial [Phycisphaerae bacterium]|nr:ketol-acid reductoisomerase [Phycisphaerae bacterium]
MKVYYEKDADVSALKGKTVAVLGYGSQGHAQAQNLRDSGVKVVVAELEGTDNYKLAVEHGFEPLSAKEASKQADLVIMTLPDEVQAAVYKSEVAGNMGKGKAIGFSHGFNIHFGQIVPPKEVDIIMVAPKGPGHLLRSEFVKGAGLPCLFAVQQDASGKAKGMALAWASGIGGTRAGVIETTFADETET